MSKKTPEPANCSQGHDYTTEVLNVGQKATHDVVRSTCRRCKGSTVTRVPR